MKWRYALPSALAGLTASILLAPATAAASNGLLSPIVPADCLCPGSAPDFGCILETFQNLLNVGVSITVLAVVAIIAYSGIMFIASGGSAESRTKARNLLLNAVIGLLVVLSAWLIVDFVMKAIYNPGAAISGQNLGPWNAILQASGVKCIKQGGGQAITDGAVSSADLADSPATAALANTPLAVGSGGACDPQKLQAGAAAGGYSLTNQQANTLACIANYESSCGAKNINYNWNARKAPPPSTAAGALQVTLKGNSPCYNNAACQAAAGVQGSLNCAAAFDSSGYPLSNSPLVNTCLQAAKNLNCSASAAACLLKQKSNTTNPYSPWIADPNSSGQGSCIRQNAG